MARAYWPVPVIPFQLCAIVKTLNKIFEQTEGKNWSIFNVPFIDFGVQCTYDRWDLDWNYEGRFEVGNPPCVL